MDRVVQKNASNAEESASASEELRVQSEQLLIFVQNLVGMVGRNGSGNGKNNAVYVQPQIKNESDQVATLTAYNSLNVKPEEVIPFDYDFSDF